MNSNYTNTSEKLLSLIPNPNLNIVQVIVFTVSSFLLEFIALSSNIFLIVNMTKKSPVPPRNHLMINLCVANLLECLLCFLVYTTSSTVGSWFLGPIMCKVLPNFLEGCRTFSFAILTILARYRCYAISQPLKVIKHKKQFMYLELLVFAAWSFGTEIGNGVGQSGQDYVKEATRCVDSLHLRNPNRIYIAVSYFSYLSFANIQQMYYFTRIAYILWKNSKHLGDNKLESSQRLKAIRKQ